VYRGREEIASIIKEMKAGQAERLADKDPANDPSPIVHHVMSNAVIDIVSPDRALHHCYWMTVAGGPELNRFRVAAEGGYEDELVKRDGQWLIYRLYLVQRRAGTRAGLQPGSGVGRFDGDGSGPQRVAQVGMAWRVCRTWPTGGTVGPSSRHPLLTGNPAIFAIELRGVMT
jgi:hypothetical protein